MRYYILERYKTGWDMIWKSHNVAGFYISNISRKLFQMFGYCRKIIG